MQAAACKVERLALSAVQVTWYFVCFLRFEGTVALLSGYRDFLSFNFHFFYYSTTLVPYTTLVPKLVVQN